MAGPVDFIFNVAMDIADVKKQMQSIGGLSKQAAQSVEQSFKGIGDFLLSPFSNAVNKTIGAASSIYSNQIGPMTSQMFGSYGDSLRASAGKFEAKASAQEWFIGQMGAMGEAHIQPTEDQMENVYQMRKYQTEGREANEQRAKNFLYNRPTYWTDQMGYQHEGDMPKGGVIDFGYGAVNKALKDGHTNTFR